MTLTANRPASAGACSQRPHKYSTGAFRAKGWGIVDLPNLCPSSICDNGCRLHGTEEMVLRCEKNEGETRQPVASPSTPVPGAGR